MTALRIAVALILGFYALVSLVPLGFNAAFHLGLYAPGEAITAAQVALMEATGWPKLALWAAAIILYLVTAALLVLRRRAFAFWAAAFALDLANWIWAKTGEAYDAAFTPQMLAVDYVILAVNLALGGLIFWMSRAHLR